MSQSGKDDIEEKLKSRKKNTEYVRRYRRKKKSTDKQVQEAVKENGVKIAELERKVEELTNLLERPGPSTRPDKSRKPRGEGSESTQVRNSNNNAEGGERPSWFGDAF